MKLETINKVKPYIIPIYLTKEKNFSLDEKTMYKIVFMESGSGIMRHNGQIRVFMAPCVLHLHDQDEVELLKDNDLDITVIYFDPAFINTEFTIENLRTRRLELREEYEIDYYYVAPFIYRDLNFDGGTDLLISQAELISKRINLLAREIVDSESKSWCVRCKGLFLEVVFMIFYILTEDKNVPRVVQTLKDDSVIYDVMLYLQTKYSEKITIKLLESIFGINRTSLTERFREVTGTTIKDYLTKIRVKVSTMLLKDTDTPISEIAYQVGFNDSTNFIRTFKKSLNCLPSEFREQGQNVTNVS